MLEDGGGLEEEDLLHRGVQGVLRDGGAFEARQRPGGVARDRGIGIGQQRADQVGGRRGIGGGHGVQRALAGQRVGVTQGPPSLVAAHGVRAARQGVERQQDDVGIGMPAVAAQELGRRRRGRHEGAGLPQALAHRHVVEERHHQRAERRVEQRVQHLEGVGAAAGVEHALAHQRHGLGIVPQLEDAQHPSHRPLATEFEHLLEQGRVVDLPGRLPTREVAVRLAHLVEDHRVDGGHRLGPELQRAPQVRQRGADSEPQVAVLDPHQGAEALVRLRHRDAAQQPRYQQLDLPRHGFPGQLVAQRRDRRRADRDQRLPGAPAAGRVAEHVDQHRHQSRIGDAGRRAERGAAHRGLGVVEELAQGPVGRGTERAQGPGGLGPVGLRGGHQQLGEPRPAVDAALDAAVQQQAGEHGDAHVGRRVRQQGNQRLDRIVPREHRVRGSGRRAHRGLRVCEPRAHLGRSDARKPGELREGRGPHRGVGMRRERGHGAR